MNQSTTENIPDCFTQSHTDEGYDPVTEVDIASQKREDQGDHECEVLAEGAEGAYQWKRCTKNPGHKKFIAAPDFTMDHLPSPHRNDLVHECVSLIARLTVRLRVQYTSKNRPDGYIFANFKGKHITHTGTGESQVEDGCCVECVTHDKDLFDQIHRDSVRLFNLEAKMYGTRVPHPWPPLCVVVSHPHGCSKQITVGSWKERMVKGLRLDSCECTEYTYTTPTCRGSSGAPVLLMGTGVGEGKCMVYITHFHSGGDPHGLNKSGVWIENTPKTNTSAKK